MTMTNEQEMYGCSKADLDEMIDDALNPYMGEHYMLAMSILSDAQERIAIGHGDIARQYINRAKYVISHWKDSTENVG
jgi:hypothetical protein